MISIPFVPSDASPFLLLWVVFLGFLGIVLAAHLLMLAVRLTIHLRVRWLLKEYLRPR